jgi:hypothetical protein
LLFPSIIGFSIIPLWLGIREAIYHKMYEVWNNGFYTPSIDDNVTQEQTKFTSVIDEDSDINVDLS